MSKSHWPMQMREWKEWIELQILIIEGAGAFQEAGSRRVRLRARIAEESWLIQ